MPLSVCLSVCLYLSVSRSCIVTTLTWLVVMKLRLMHDADSSKHTSNYFTAIELMPQLQLLMLHLLLLLLMMMMMMTLLQPKNDCLEWWDSSYVNYTEFICHGHVCRSSISTSRPSCFFVHLILYWCSPRSDVHHLRHIMMMIIMLSWWWWWCGHLGAGNVTCHLATRARLSPVEIIRFVQDTGGIFGLDISLKRFESGRVVTIQEEPIIKNTTKERSCHKATWPVWKISYAGIHVQSLNHAQLARVLCFIIIIIKDIYIAPFRHAPKSAVQDES